MRRTILLVSGLALAGANAHAASWTLIRRISQIASCAASMADAATTRRSGLIETNALLGDGAPQPGRIAALKLGVCAGQIAIAEILHARNRGNRGSIGEKIGTAGALGQAGYFGALALRNSALGIGGAR